MRTVSLMLIFVLIVPLLVAQTKSSDDKIYNEVREKLAVDADVRGAAFDVDVKNGTVTLRGKVHTLKAKEKAEKIVKKIKGVVSVDNHLTLFSD
ncbi:MAG: BON domain-containing protein [Bryobacterales bacterium]|nr:BON domain-containing protein [Bryobacterales bacterium]MBV9397072.1 BON domain-containing protein [Bryobacterales bacterium]